MTTPTQDNDQPVSTGGPAQEPVKLTPVTARAGTDLLAPAGSTTAARPGSLRSLLRFRGTIALIAILVAGPAVAMIWRYTPPLYSASGQIRVRPIIPHLVFRTEDNGEVPFYQGYLNTQVALVSSPIVLQRALTQPDVQATQWYHDAGQTGPLAGSGSRLEQLRGQLGVLPRPRTEIIDVSMETGYAHDAATIVNAVLDQYLRHARELSSEESDRIYDKLIAQHEALKRQLREKEQAIEQLHRQLGTTDPEKLIADQRVRLDAMANEADAFKRAQAVARWRLERLQRSSTAPPTTGPENSTRYQSDGEWWRLKEDVARLDMSLAAERERLGPLHPKILDLARQRNFASEMLAARQRLLDQGGGPIDATGLFGADPVRTAQDELGLSTYQGQLVADSLARQRHAWQATFDGAELLNRQLAELRDVRELFDAVKSRMESKRMERNVPGSIEVLARAIEPKAVSKDRRWAYSALAVLVALAIGATAAGLRASAQRATVDAEMLPAGDVGPFVSLVPLVSPRRSMPMKDPRLLERVRTVRTVLLGRIDSGQGNVVMLTSAEPREGKTTISVMLARSLAQYGKRVLLVDADARNPQVASALGLKAPASGFLQALAQGRSIHEAVMDTSVPRLRIAPGRSARNGEESDAFSSGPFTDALDRWREEYDVVLIDTAPVLSSADALILAPRVDGTVFVVRMEQTGAGAMREALSYLTNVGAHVWGTVVIGQECNCTCAGYSHGSN